MSSSAAALDRVHAELQRVAASGLPRVLFVGHALGGGVRRHMEDLAGLLRERCDIVWLEPAVRDCVRLVLARHAASACAVYLRLPSEFAALAALLAATGVARIHYHHVHGMPREVLDLPRALGVPYDVTLHDYYALCPAADWPGTEELTDPRAEAGCVAAMAGTPLPWGYSVREWRDTFAHMLHHAARVIAPSQDVARRYRRVWPDLQVAVWPHPEPLAVPQPGVVRVIAIGRLSPGKGLRVIAACARDARERGLPLWFRIVGSATESVPQFPELPLTIAGEYRDEVLGELLAAERPDVVLMPNQVPESYGYTLSAALIAGDVPIVAADVGSFSERLRDFPRCRMLPRDAPPRVWNDALLAIAPPPEAARPRITGSPGMLPAEYVARYMEGIEGAAVHAATDLPAIDEAWLTPPAGDPSPPLPVLYRAGVEWGQRESRIELGRRLEAAQRAEARAADEIDRALRLSHAAEIEVLEALADRERVMAAEREAEREIDRAHAWNAQVQEELAEVRQVHAATRQELVLARAARDAIVRERGVLEHALRHTREELASVLEAHERLCAMHEQALQRADSVEQDVERARNRIRELEQSTSWRITAPVRAMGRQAHVLAARMRAGTASVRHLRRQAALARNVWREQGAAALARRLWAKLGRAHRYQPPQPVSYTVDDDIQPLAFPELVPAARSVSIIVPVYGQHTLTYNCLKSVLANTAAGRYEVVLVDDASPQPLAAALPHLRGVRVERNAQNLGFIGSCNRGAALARGEIVLFLNNDTIVTPGWLDAMVAVFETRCDAGLVGVKLVYPDGRLQEAGGIIWRDGSGWNSGRNGDPQAPEHNFVREVDYCSGACLAIPTALFRELGGFDTRYAPAYYEDTDLAFAVRAAGRKVYYQPRATVVHFEGRSSGTDLASGVKQHQVKNQRRFAEKWAAKLATHRPNGMHPELERDRYVRRRVLIVDACMLTPDQDSGSMRMQAALELMVELGCKVTFVADNLEHRQPYVSDLQQRGVEVLFHPYVTSVADVLAQRGREFDVVLLSRHYIAVQHFDAVRRFAPQALLVFDTVDLHFLRAERQAELEGGAAVEIARAKREEELALINAADVTLVVSPIERALLARLAPGAEVAILSNIHDLFAPGAPFAQREGMLFIGGFRHPPNVDAMLWYTREILPHVRTMLPGVVTYIIGAEPPPAIRDLAGDDVVVTGHVPDVAPYFARCRLSISPLRYGAGVKGKINLAMCYGVPVVATSPSVEGMYLEPGTDVLVADEPEAFASAMAAAYRDEALWQRLAEGGRTNIREHFSRDVARAAIADLLVRVPRSVRSVAGPAVAENAA